VVGHRFESPISASVLLRSAIVEPKQGAARPSFESDQQLGRKMIVNCRGAKPRPDAGGRSVAVKACHEADARRRQSGPRCARVDNSVRDDDVACRIMISHFRVWPRAPYLINLFEIFGDFLALAPRMITQRPDRAGKSADKFVEVRRSAGSAWYFVQRRIRSERGFGMLAAHKSRQIRV